MRFPFAAACLSVLISSRPEAAFAQAGTSPPPGSAVPASPVITPVILLPDLRPRIYVKDLDHLAQLVKEDPALETEAQALVARRTAGLSVGGVIMTTGIVVALTGTGNQSCHDSVPFQGWAPMRTCEMDPTQLLVGTAISAAGALIGAIIVPKPGELLDLINAWNRSHPTRPFELSGGLHPMLDQVEQPTP